MICEYHEHFRSSCASLHAYIKAYVEKITHRD